jgi:hypothetical protein
MKNLMKIAGALFVSLLLWCAPASAQPVPTFPVNPYLDSWSFYDPTNWLSDLSYAPIGFTNIVNDDSCWASDDGVLDCNGLLMDSSDPAFLNYKTVEDDGHTNLICSAGTLWFWFSPDWDSESQGGAGPGDWGRFVDVGAWTSNAVFGWWSLMVSPDGNNIYFSGQTNGAGTNYLTCPISWTAGSWHLVGLTYSATNSTLYLDGEVATNGIGVIYPPNHGVLTNGFWIGSDSYSGTQQAHGEFVDFEAWSDQFFTMNSTNFFSDYYHAMLPELPGGGFFSMDSFFSPPDFSSGGGSGGGFPNIYGTNLWLYIAGIQSNTVGLFLINTEPDISYEIQSRTNLLQTNWFSEGLVLGSEITNFTEMDIPQGNRTNNLFMRIRSWQSSDGSGLPDWWESLYFGATAVDPYGDPAGDGWNNYQKFINGMNPASFYTPPAPQNLTLQVDSTGTNVTLSWQSGGGNVSQYEVDESGSVLGYVSASQTNYTTSLDQVYFGTEFSPPSFSVTALFSNGISSASATVDLSPEMEFGNVLLATNSQGQLEFVTSYLPPNIATVRLFWVTNVFDVITGDESDNAYYDIPATNIVNGVYVFPNNAAESFILNPDYLTFIEPKYQSGQYEFGVVWNINLGSWVNNSTNLKANLDFLLRSATVNHPFSYDSSVLEFPDIYFSRAGAGSDYEYSGYRYDDGYGGLRMDAMQPVEENYLWRNFAYVVGDLSTRADYDTDLQERQIDSSPEYQFTTGDSLTPILTDSTASFYYYRSAAYPSFEPAAYTEIGLGVDGSGKVYLPSGVKNLYGLSVEAVKSSESAEVDAGASATVPYTAFGPSWYVETAVPSLQTVGYYFASQPPVPGTAGFSATNTSQLLITGIGQNLTVMGWAKQAILNGYTDKFAYLEQYFDKAYQMNTNGMVTTNLTGFLDAYGDFTPTNIGPVALVTMPDIDTGARGTCTVYSVSMQLDANHDGNMDLSFGGPDNTSQANPMRFWINNDNDGTGVGQDTDAPKQPDSTNNVIQSMRDLEDFARLWICGMPSIDSTEGYQVSLYWRNYTGNPAIKIFPTYSAHGGTEYLTDYTNAQHTVGYSTYGEVSTNSNLVFPDLFFYNTGKKYFLFEGVTAGSGELVMNISLNGSTVAETSVWLDLHDVKDLYEQAHAINVTSVPPSTNTSIFVQDKIAPTSPTEDQQVIMFVHGLNVGAWEYHSESETMFKRLYWQGYYGRFAAFDWPSPLFALIPTDTNEISYFGFNTGEYVSWHSGAALKAYIDNLRSRLPGYAINLAVHSLGNVAANEAIREGAQVDNYALMQAAISAGAFDGNNSALTYDYLATTASTSPGASALGGYNNCFTNATRRVNFYNDDDFALFEGVVGGITTHTWEGNQLDYKPDSYDFFLGSHYVYSFDGTNCFLRQYNGIGGLLSSRTLTEDFEKKAYVARSRTKAVGAAGLKYDPFTLTGGLISTNISLQDASLGFVGGAQFGDVRPEHSGEFTKPIQNTTPFYFQLMKMGFQLQPQLSP